MNPDEESQLAASVAAFKERQRQQIDHIKTRLTTWLDQNTHPAEGAEVKFALLEMAIERYLEIFDGVEALEMIQSRFRKIFETRNRRLH